MPVSQPTVDLVNQLVAQTQANLTAYQELQALVQNGYQSDQDNIAAQIQAALNPVQTVITSALNAVAQPANQVAQPADPAPKI
jgi:hypothetical protein